MSTCSPQTLLSDASGFAGLPPGMRYPVKLALLTQILKQANPNYVLNVQQLVSDASCFLCVSPGIWPILKLQLMCNILQSQPEVSVSLSFSDPLLYWAFTGSLPSGMDNWQIQAFIGGVWIAVHSNGVSDLDWDPTNDFSSQTVQFRVYGAKTVAGNPVPVTDYSNTVSVTFP